MTFHVAWTATRGLRILDQTLLPRDERYVDLESVAAVAEAILTLRVRGAPLLGVAGAMAVAGEAARQAAAGVSREEAMGAVSRAAELLAATRPTAVNLRWGIERVLRTVLAAPGDAPALARVAADEAQAIWDEDRAMCDAIGRFGLDLVPDGAIVHTHCNAGSLATGGIGTALAPVYAAHAAGRRVQVIADETRPLLQGARLTAWELARAGIPVTVIADGMAAARLAQGDVTCVIVGADRIAANGDVANKIGTHALALAARAAGVPFYVAAPRSTLDVATPSGADIHIELRARAEIAGTDDAPSVPHGASVWNPAFDVTPAHLITGIITDVGIVAPGVVGALG
jgi:methylthioribose-1-phosphate isomerase